jgi:hypothetical protein
MNEPTNDHDYFLIPERKLGRYWWIVAALLGLVLLGTAVLLFALGPGNLMGLSFNPQPSATPVPTSTPPELLSPTATPLPEGTFSARPWTDGSGPVGLIEFTLVLPIAARVNHEPPPGFCYWQGDLLPTRQGLAWTGSGPAEVHWFLFHEPGTAFPATVTVTVNGQTLALALYPGTPATVSAMFE